MELAESSPAVYQNTYVTRDADRPAEAKKKPAKASHLLDEERNAAEHNPREKFHRWMERLDDKKQRWKDSRGTSATKQKGKKPDLKLPKLKELDFSKMKEKINEALPENELFQDAEKTSTFDVFEMEPLSSESKMDEDTDRHVPKKTDSSKDEKIGTIVSIVVALVFFLIGSCGDSSVDEDYEEPAYSYIYDQSIDDIEETDLEVADLADQSYMLLIEQTEHESAILEDDRESDYRDKADLFAQKYWNKDSIAQISDYLYQNYGDYFVSSDDPVSTQLDAVFSFYGFASLDSASWYDQPYTGERIKSYGDYLDYLNQFYDAQ